MSQRDKIIIEVFQKKKAGAPFKSIGKVVAAVSGVHLFHSTIGIT